MTHERADILVVDDTVDSLNLLSEMLTREGYRVRAFPRAAPALRACRRHPPDLVLSDINMPEMSGYDLCRALKEDAELRDIPVLFISAYREMEEKVRAFREGGMDYITKPFRVEEIMARIRTQLQVRMYARKLERRNADLAAAIDDLKATRGRLAEAEWDRAHKAGMAEIAVSVLHYLGNIFNSVVISNEAMNRTLKGRNLEALDWAGDLLDQHKDNLTDFFTHSRKGKHLADYLTAIVPQMVADYQTMREEADRVDGLIQTIRAVIIDQQNYAGNQVETNVLSLRQLVEDALVFVSDNIYHHKIVVQNMVPPDITRDLPKVKINYVLTSIVKNAVEALESDSVAEKLLTIFTQRVDDELALVIRDTGVGLSDQHKKRLFHHGYTTKPNHLGFGLHGAATRMNEMGGRIRLESEGPGTGASVYLYLPR